MNELVLNLRKSNQLLDYGSRLILLVLLSTPLQERLLANGFWIINFVTVPLFLLGLVLIAFAYIDAEKIQKKFQINLRELNIKRTYWLAPFLAFIVGAFTAYVSIEPASLSEWIKWPLIIITLSISEFYSYKRNQILKNIKIQ